MYIARLVSYGDGFQTPRIIKEFQVSKKAHPFVRLAQGIERKWQKWLPDAETSEHIVLEVLESERPHALVATQPLFFDYYSVPEAASRMGVSLGRIRQLIYSKRLPATYRSGRWWISHSDLFRFQRRPTGRPRKTETAQTSHRPAQMRWSGSSND